MTASFSPVTYADLLAAVAHARPPLPQTPRPIVSIGAGGIVQAAHLPAYAKAGFPVIAIADPAPGRAAGLALDFNIPRSFTSPSDAIAYAPADAVFDVAVPASQLLNILPLLPFKATVLIQKPMGETLAEARAIRDLCRSRSFTAAVNFSLRYSPNNLAARSLHQRGLLGELHDMEVQTRTYTPWQLWSFLATAPRLEILYHSIHYLDLVRSWFSERYGEPEGVYCKTVRNPQSPHLAPTRSTILLDYGPSKRVFIATNHAHDFGDRYQLSFAQWEGTGGAARITMGLNLDYPRGKPDTLEYAQRDDPSRSWHTLPVSGENFPDAFIGTMGALQAYAEGSAPTLPSHFEDAFKTMALVEACYRSSEHAAEPIPAE